MRVSVVIPTYNRAGLLSELLESLRAQSHRPLECVVVDDSSTDDTAATISDFLRSCDIDSGLTLNYQRIPKRGAQAARNAGIRAASGGALMFVDSDDLLATSGIVDLVAKLQKSPDLQFVYGKVEVTDIDANRRSRSEVIGSPFGNSASDLVGYHWHTMGALYRRECVERIGFWNEELKCSQDWEYQIRAKLFGGQGCFVDALVGYWRQHAHDRIGGKAFREDYAESTEPLFRSIYESAQLAHRATRVFESLLAKRLLRHAIYCGANDRPQIKQRILDLVSAIGGDKGLTSVGVWGCRRTPPWLDKMTIAALNRVRPANTAKVL